MRLIYLLCLIRPSELHTLSSRVDVFGRPGGCLSSSSTLPYSETIASFPRVSVTLHLIHRFSVMLNDAVPFTHESGIILRFSIFDHASSRPAIFQLVCVAI